MLKIKDTVKLEELEKFGFYKTSETSFGYEMINTIDWSDFDEEIDFDAPYWCDISINISDREIVIIPNCVVENGVAESFYLPNCIFDLIKADLVEKVGE